jgi:predicted DNA-binding transcriptional regulator YafY
VSTKTKKKKSGGRHAQQGRLLSVVRALIERAPQDRNSIATIAGVEVAGADRILKALHQFVPQFEVSETRPRTIKFNQELAGPPPQLSHAIAACFGASLAALFKGTDYERGMEGALQYVLKGYPRKALFKDINRKFVFVRRGGELSLPEKKEELEELIDAVLRHRVTRIRYEHGYGSEHQVTIWPLSLAVYDHQLYVIGRSKQRSAYPYRFARIKEAEAGPPNGFEYPLKAQYDPDQVFRDSFGVFISDDHPIEDIAIRVSPLWARIAKSHRWHDSQQVDDEKAGVQSVIKLRVRVCPEVVSWILGLGSHAEVLKPAWLRVRIASTAREISKIYRKDSSG